MLPRLPMFRSESSSDALTTLQREVNRVFDQMFGGAASAPLAAFAPSVEMKETDQGLVVTAELPGIDEKDVEVSLEGDLLTLSGQKQQEKTEEKAGVHLPNAPMAAPPQPRLPWAADPAKAHAGFDKGVLTAMPRPPEAAPSVNRILISGSGAPPA